MNDRSTPFAASLMPGSAPRFLLVSLVVALIAGLLFTPGLPGEFLFDDVPNIVNNHVIHLRDITTAGLLEVLATPQISGTMRSLPTLTFALDYWRGGGADPGTFKTTNIVIHALTACALAWFFRVLLAVSGLSSGRVAWLAPTLALVWAAHPIQVSSVLYTVQRLQTMGTLFLALALLAYLHARQAQIQGRVGRPALMTAGLFWAFALGCKEDSALLPAYTLALELTVLRFAAADTRVTSMLRRAYLMISITGVAAYLFWFLPNTWQWDSYPGREFNTLERLLTQPRVLCMYLWQIVVPLPQHMPFHYDWVQPSRSLLQPWTTLPAIGAVVALLALAWLVRIRHPLLAAGILLFFSAHFIASNVIGLELAFEHRNHFALIGAILALGHVLAQVDLRLQIQPALKIGLAAILLAALGSATVLRAESWSSNVSLARASTMAAPGSPRAWIELCDSLFIAGGGVAPANPELDEAIRACSSGANAAPGSLNNLALLIVLKTIRGDVTAQDWNRFQHRLEAVRLSWDNIRAPLIFGHYAGLGVGLEKNEVLRAYATLDGRTNLGPSTLIAIADSLANDWAEPERAVDYYVRVIDALEAGDPIAWQLGTELRAKGRPDLAVVVEEHGQRRLDAALARGLD